VGNTGLELNGSLAYLDAYYTSVNANANLPEYALPDGTTICPAGPAAGCSASRGGSPLEAKLPKTPRWKFTFAPTYTYELGNQAQLRFLPVFTYVTSMFNDSLNTPQMRRPVTRNLDVSAHYVTPSGRYDLAIGGTNLTNDRYITLGPAELRCWFHRCVLQRTTAVVRDSANADRRVSNHLLRLVHNVSRNPLPCFIRSRSTGQHVECHVDDHILLSSDHVTPPQLDQDGACIETMLASYLLRMAQEAGINARITQCQRLTIDPDRPVLQRTYEVFGGIHESEEVGAMIPAV